MTRRKHTIDYWRQLAKLKGGECLSTEHKSVDSKLTWQCSLGHQWSATPYSVEKLDTWCPYCAGKNRTIEQMRELAKERGGKCLSTQYKGYKSKLRWECSNGHTWEATPGSIYGLNSWCPYCAGNRMLTKKSLNDIAAKRGGKCLSSKYAGVDETYKWECSLGHHFSNRFSKVKKGQWCPTCSKAGISEEVARTTFEQMTGKNFPKIRPVWLKNERGYQMEFDGYCEELGIAFEYHGVQHYKQNSVYMKDQKSLNRRINDDMVKQQLANKHGVKLFVLNYTSDYADFPHLILKQAESFSLSPAIFGKVKEIDFDRAYVRTDRINELIEIAKSKNGYLISTKWLGVGYFYSVHCNVCGNEWRVKGSEMLSGAWCDKCARRIGGEKRMGSLADVQAYADIHEGLVLSSKYTGASSKYAFQCKNGHQFEAKLNNLKFRNQWCPVCKKLHASKKQSSTQNVAQ